MQFLKYQYLKNLVYLLFDFAVRFLEFEIVAAATFVEAEPPYLMTLAVHFPLESVPTNEMFHQVLQKLVQQHCVLERVE